MRLGEKHYDNGEVEIAEGLWAQAVAYGRHISIRQPNTRIQHLVGIGLQAMGPLRGGDRYYRGESVARR